MLYRIFVISISCLLLFTTDLAANDARKAVREGNNLYKEGAYAAAEIAFRRALESDPQNFRAWFNLGNALYQQGRHQEAAEIFDRLSVSAPNDTQKAASFHNKGNALLKEQKFAESVEAYKNALRHQPEDEASRYNLAYAMQYLQDPPPEDQAADGKDEQEEEQEQEQDQQQQKEPDQPEESGDNRHEAAPEQLSAREAERLLDALNQLEQKTLEQLKREEESHQKIHVEKEW